MKLVGWLVGWLVGRDSIHDVGYPNCVPSTTN